MTTVNYPVNENERRNYKVFSKKELQRANNLARRRNYNRSVDPGFLKKLSDYNLYPITMSFVHEHAGGLKVDSHMRCWIGAVINEKVESFFIDVDMKLYDSLEIISVPVKKESDS